MSNDQGGVSAMSAELGLDVDFLIDLASDCNLGRKMKPLGYNAGEVFGTDASYRTSELIDFSCRLVAADRGRLATWIEREYGNKAASDHIAAIVAVLRKA